jgi:hypothetical protein
MKRRFTAQKLSDEPSWSRQDRPFLDVGPWRALGRSPPKTPHARITRAFCGLRDWRGRPEILQNRPLWLRIVLQNYFWPGTEERHSKLSSEQRILIQETTVSDSIIAHFGRSTAHRPTFATQSLVSQTPSFSDARPSADHRTPPPDAHILALGAENPSRGAWTFSLRYFSF